MDRYGGSIRILHMLEGAREATGLTVIIDVFRAFSLECFLYGSGAACIRPSGSLEETYAYRDRIPGCILAGERGGMRCEGFELGNSPFLAQRMDVNGKTVIHTTSAGTQGIVNAVNASEIITGSMVNAAAVSEYIQRQCPEEVSLVCMGTEGREEGPEDELCAEYIRSLLLGETLPDIDNRLTALKDTAGKRFFVPGMQEDLPEQDFWMCIQRDVFPFVIRVGRDGLGLYTEKIDLG